MKAINIYSHVLNRCVCDDDLFKKYSKIECDCNDKIIKSSDENGLEELVRKINETNAEIDFSNFEGFYFNYSIPHISKELDLLRIGVEDVINIEIKSNQCMDKVEYQLRRNKYYLNVLGKPVYNFAFLYETNKLYQLIDCNLVEVDFESLVLLLKNQNVLYISDIDELFNPKQYLVSPFNNSLNFINGEYFLTSQQEEFRNEILENLQNGDTFSIIEGKSGTGKSLLLYDIAKILINGKDIMYEEVAIIHCGIINPGHKYLIENGYNILSIKEYDCVLNDYKRKVFLIDEAQRIKVEQLQRIIKYCRETNSNIIFSMDKRQILNDREVREEPSQYIYNIPKIKKYTLSTRIRSNKEIEYFLEKIMNPQCKIEAQSCKNVEIVHVDDIDMANKYIDNRKKDGFIFLNYTKSYETEDFDFTLLNGEDGNAHQIIGQEFDKVIVTLNHLFLLRDGQLLTKQWGDFHYLPIPMFFQAITRARTTLCIVVINNKELCRHLIEIVSGK